MSKVSVDDIKKGISISRKILGWLTDARDKLPLPVWAKKFLGAGRSAGLWTEKNTPLRSDWRK